MPTPALENEISAHTFFPTLLACVFSDLPRIDSGTGSHQGCAHGGREAQVHAPEEGQSGSVGGMAMVLRDEGTGTSKVKGGRTRLAAAG